MFKPKLPPNGDNNALKSDLTIDFVSELAIIS